VGSAGSYSYEELQNLPSTSRAVTLECIADGTNAGGRLISTAVWQGVTLRSLLERHCAGVLVAAIFNPYRLLVAAWDWPGGAWAVVPGSKPGWERVMLNWSVGHRGAVSQKNRTRLL
jgi:hypothetical protein